MIFLIVSYCLEFKRWWWFTDAWGNARGIVALLTSSRGMTAPQLFGQFRGFLLHSRSWNYWDEMKWNEINHLSSNWSFKQRTIFQTVIIERGYETHTQDALLLSLLSTNLHIFMHQLRERLSVVKEMWGCRSWLNAHSLKVSAPMLSEARRVLTPSLKRKSLFFFCFFLRATSMTRGLFVY